jgi:hypothetical protein
VGLPRWSCFACGHCQPLMTLTPSEPRCSEFGGEPLRSCGSEKRELSLPYEITGHKPHLQGAFSRTVAATATAALRIARQWAQQGMTGITIVTPRGESYDLDNFGMIVSTTDEEYHPDQISEPRERRCTRSLATLNDIGGGH